MHVRKRRSAAVVCPRMLRLFLAVVHNITLVLRRTRRRGTWRTYTRARGFAFSGFLFRRSYEVYGLSIFQPRHFPSALLPSQFLPIFLNFHARTARTWWPHTLEHLCFYFNSRYTFMYIVTAREILSRKDIYFVIWVFRRMVNK